MIRLEVIGNLGANAERKVENGRSYVQFRVAHTDKFLNNQGQQIESTMWVSCFWESDGGKLLQYLLKGVKVFVRGNLGVRIYDSAATHKKEVGVSLNVREIELCGGRQETQPTTQLQEVHDLNGVRYDVAPDGLLIAKAF